MTKTRKIGIILAKSEPPDLYLGPLTHSRTPSIGQGNEIKVKYCKSKGGRRNCPAGPNFVDAMWRVAGISPLVTRTLGLYAW